MCSLGSTWAQVDEQVVAGPFILPVTAPFCGDQVAPLGAAAVQEWLLDSRTHPIQGVNGTISFHLRFSA